ncbi:putative Receptor L-domain superfamily [Septoria linicola]|nr:putative Receptor L-domain superfamily [Septoria linicola]
MAAFRYIVPALALAGSAVAQCGESGSTTTLQSAADATGLSGCSTYSGSIAISTSTTENINLAGISTIEGSLVADNVTGIVQISAPDLEEIGDTFDLNGLTILSTLSFPRLAKVDTISWIALPALQGLTFSNTGVQEVSMLTIDNTELASLDGINLQVADTIYIANNRFLDSVNMQLGNVTDSLTFTNNGAELVAEFPNLEWANNITIRNLSSVSVPSLSSVNGSLGFYGNTFESLSAPNLTNVGGSLAFVSNDQLSNITLPELTTVGGGFQIANNSALENINGFPKLETVGGALDFTGSFNNVELPALGDVRGAFTMLSNQNIDDTCSTFQAEAGSAKAIKGKFECQGETDPEDGSATSSGSGSSKSSSAAHPVLIPGATGVLGVVAAIFGLL